MKLDKTGFTLLEIMIALAIIGITVTVILSSVNFHTNIMHENTVTTQLYQLAKEKMFELEKSVLPSKGVFDTPKGYSYENIVNGMEDTNIIKLKTIVKGSGKEVVLNRLIIKRSG